MPFQNITSLNTPLASQLKTSIGKASDIAEQQVGNSSRTVSAYLTALNGFAVYDASVIDKGGNLHGFLIDPANGKVVAQYGLGSGVLGQMTPIQMKPEVNAIAGTNMTNATMGGNMTK